MFPRPIVRHHRRVLLAAAWTAFTLILVQCTFPHLAFPLLTFRLGTGDMPDKVTEHRYCATKLTIQEPVLEAMVAQMSLYPPETVFFLNVWCFGWEDVVKEVARHFDTLVSIDSTQMQGLPFLTYRSMSIHTNAVSMALSKATHSSSAAQPRIPKQRASTRASDTTGATNAKSIKANLSCKSRWSKSSPLPGI